jgi:hypothetical protein
MILLILTMMIFFKVEFNEFFQYLLSHLERGDSKINIDTDKKRRKVRVTVTRNLQGGIPENKVVRDNLFIRTVNTYRNGSKTGMQIITSEEFECTFHSGDIADHPLKRQSATSDSPHDTAR